MIAAFAPAAWPGGKAGDPALLGLAVRIGGTSRRLAAPAASPSQPLPETPNGR